MIRSIEYLKYCITDSGKVDLTVNAVERVSGGISAGGGISSGYVISSWVHV